jgi:hypothetical protein
MRSPNGFSGDLFENNELDPQGWRVTPVSDLEVRQFRATSRATMPLVVVRDTLTRLRPPEEGQKTVIIGKRMANDAPFNRLFQQIMQMAGSNHHIPDASVVRPGLAVQFPDMPTPYELNDFLARNTREQTGTFQDWTHDGQVQYTTISGGDDPVHIEFGTLNLQDQTRTRADLPI